MRQVSQRVTVPSHSFGLCSERALQWVVLGGASRSNTADMHAYVNWLNIEERLYLFSEVKP